MRRIAEAVKALTSDSALSDVKDSLDELKIDRKEFKEDIEELAQVTQKEKVRKLITQVFMLIGQICNQT